MINVDNLRALAKANRESKEPLDMDKYCKLECGTPCCVLGNYAARKDLQKLMVIRSDGDTYRVEYRHRPLIFPDDLRWLVDFDDGYILDHFGITRDESCELFFLPKGLGNACKTPQEAADYIDRFIERKLNKESKHTE